MSQTLQTTLTPLPGEVKVKAKMKTKMKADVAHAALTAPPLGRRNPRCDTRRASPLGSASKKTHGTRQKDEDARGGDGGEGFGLRERRCGLDARDSPESRLVVDLGRSFP